MPKRSRLIVVANRLPVNQVASGSRRTGKSVKPTWQSSSGGLVTALGPILKQCDGTWVGWTGIAGKSTRAFRFEGLKIRPVPVSDREEDAYYNHISNRTLWPLYHDAIRTPEFDHNYWRPYIAVNERFARATAEVAKRGDLVWVHDYQLQLVPRMLRTLRPDLRIGFFLHIPFPPEELFAWLPWREQILNGMLGADVVGFQTHAAAQNFSRAAREYTEAEGTDLHLTLGKRDVTVGSFPVSIDFDWFESQALREESIADAREIRRRLGARTMLLAVDRLDYTKGIDLRLRAFEMLLKSRKVSVNDCVLVQIATPSREQAFEYAEMRTRIEQLVGRINGEFSGPVRVAVHYFRRNLKREELAAYYRAADVMLVTPLRDGMNLVAKEYLATRTDNSGTLRTTRLYPELVRRSALAIKSPCHGPTGAIAAAATTSLPEHLGGVRNWDYRYCWIRDACMSAAALVRIGNTGVALKLLDWLVQVVEQCESPERLRPLYTVSGNTLGPEAEISELTGYGQSRPVRIGNAASHQVQLDVFGPVVELVALMTDGGAPVTPEQWHLVEAMVKAVELRWEEPDHGIWEIRGPKRHHVHSKTMCWLAVDRGLYVAEQAMGLERPDWVRLRDRIAKDVLDRGFNAEAGFFTAAYGETVADAASLAVGLYGLIPADDPRFVATVEAIEHELRDGPAVHRYLGDDGLPGREGAWVICACWLVECLAMIGRTEEARTLLDKIAALAGPTGLMSEEWDAQHGIPLGNFPQAYSHLGLINAVMRLELLGIK